MIAESRATRVASLLLFSVLAACGGRETSTARSGTAGGASTSRDNKPLTIKGSDTMVVLGQRLAEEYMKKNPAATVQVNGGGSGTGIAALINGSADLAQSSRPMEGDEKEQARQQRGAEVVETAVALDALAIFVHQANPVKSLTIQQVADIYMGKTKNWRQLGGPNSTIVLYGRENSSGTYDYFREHVLNKGDFAPQVQTLQGTAAIINAVARDRNGIGYGGIAYAKDVRAIGIQDKAAARSVTPSEATVADGTYPLSRKLYFYYPSNAAERVTKFVEWSLTTDAQALVANVGYFPLNTTGSQQTATSTTDITTSGR